MITNQIMTYYHKNVKTDKWERTLFGSVWAYGGKGSFVNAGYENNNNVNIRIPMEFVEDRNIFAIGDIIAIGVHPNIEKQSDLKCCEFYNVISININDFGNNPHVHLGGK